MWQYNQSSELYHYGVLGMKWGQRRANRLTKTGSFNTIRLKRAVNNSNKDVRNLQKHGYQSEANAVKKVGSKTKKNLEKSIIKDRAKAQKIRTKIEKKYSDDSAEAIRIGKKPVREMSNSELRKVNERSQLEQQYRNLNQTKIKKGIKFLAGAGSLMGTVVTVYNNGNALVKIGSKFVKR